MLLKKKKKKLIKDKPSTKCFGPYIFLSFFLFFFGHKFIRYCFAMTIGGSQY